MSDKQNRSALLRHGRLLRRVGAWTIVVFAATFVALGYVLSGIFERALERELGIRLESAAKSLSASFVFRSGLAGLAESIEELRDSDAIRRAAYYSDLSKELARLGNQLAARRVAFYSKDENGNAKLLLEYPESALLFGEDPFLKIHQREADEAFAGETSSTILYEFQNEWYQAAFSPVEAEGAGKFVAMVELDASFTSAREEFTTKFVTVLLIGLVGVVVLSIMLSRQIVVPIMELYSAMGIEDDRGLPVKVDVKRSDELGRLARSFNKLIDRLREKDDRLREALRSEELRADRIESYAETVLDQLSPCLVSADQSGIVTKWNASSARRFGLAESQIVGKPVGALPAGFGEIAERLIAAEPSSFEITLQTEGPEPATFDVVVFVLRHEDQLLGASALLTETTQRKKLEQMLRRSERLAALGAFSAGVAHEIRNPLAAMRGFAALLARKLENVEQRELAERIEKEIRELNSVVTGVLEFASPSKSPPEKFDLERVMREAVEMARLDDESNVVMKVEDRGDYAYTGRPAEIKRAIINITRNALQAKPAPGDVEVSLSSNNGKLVLSIRDYGPGIPKENMEEIFNPFYTTKPGGLGLGLAISARLIENNGGTIALENQTPRGVRFTITFSKTDG
ncbi:MAG: ATP-binding protein [Planctomycetes bacterium]|nr:ATP-binding protein [Planctomycetota bacterium]